MRVYTRSVYARGVPACFLVFVCESSLLCVFANVLFRCTEHGKYGFSHARRRRATAHRPRDRGRLEGGRPRCADSGEVRRPQRGVRTPEGARSETLANLSDSPRSRSSETRPCRALRHRIGKGIHHRKHRDRIKTVKSPGLQCTLQLAYRHRQVHCSLYSTDTRQANRFPRENGWGGLRRHGLRPRPHASITVAASGAPPPPRNGSCYSRRQAPLRTAAERRRRLGRRLHG